MWTFNRADLHAALDMVKAGVAETTTLPILRQILVEFAPGYARARSSNLMCNISADLPVTGDGATGICLPGELLAQVISGWPDEPITVKVNDETRTAELFISYEHGRDHATLRGLNPLDFPSIPYLAEARPAFTVLTHQLLRLIKYARAALPSSSHSGSLSMQHIALELADSDLYAIGTDGVRLHVAYETLEPPQPQAGVWLIERAVLGDLLAVLVQWDGPIMATAVPGKFLSLEGGGTRIVLRLGDFGYFPWRDVVTEREATPEQAISVAPAELSRALRVVGAIAEQETLSRIDKARVWLDVSGGDQLIVRASADEYTSARATLDARGSIPGRSPILLNSAMLTEAVRLGRGEEVILRVPLEANTFSHVGCIVVTERGGQYSAYLMPMSVKEPVGVA